MNRLKLKFYENRLEKEMKLHKTKQKQKERLDALKPQDGQEVVVRTYLMGWIPYVTSSIDITLIFHII